MLSTQNTASGQPDFLRKRSLARFTRTFVVYLELSTEIQFPFHRQIFHFKVEIFCIILVHPLLDTQSSVEYVADCYLICSVPAESTLWNFKDCHVMFWETCCLMASPYLGFFCLKKKNIVQELGDRILILFNVWSSSFKRISEFPLHLMVTWLIG